MNRALLSEVTTDVTAPQLSAGYSMLAGRYKLGMVVWA